jgi:hypothetical protein
MQICKYSRYSGIKFKYPSTNSLLQTLDAHDQPESIVMCIFSGVSMWAAFIIYGDVNYYWVCNFNM